MEQHYIPRFYLEAFQDPTTPAGQTPALWITDLKNVGKRTDYYAFPDGGQANQKVEDLLSQIESHAAPIVARLRQGQEGLASQERADLAYFMAFLATRVPVFRDAIETFMAELAEDVMTMSASHTEYFKRTYRKANAGKEFTEAEIEDARQAILRRAYKVRAKPPLSLAAAVEAANDTIYPVLVEMRWAFLSAGEGASFLTCDNPVSWVDPTLRPGFYGSGLAMKKVEVTFPIGPKLCLLATWEGPSGRVPAPDRLVSEMNRRRTGFAGRFVFANSEQDALDALRLFQAERAKTQSRPAE